MKLSPTAQVHPQLVLLYTAPFCLYATTGFTIYEPLAWFRGTHHSSLLLPFALSSAFVSIAFLGWLTLQHHPFKLCYFQQSIKPTRHKLLPSCYIAVENAQSSQLNLLQFDFLLVRHCQNLETSYSSITARQHVAMQHQACHYLAPF